MPSLRDMFKKTSYITLSDDNEPSIKEQQPSIPEGLFTKCKKCGAALYTEDLEQEYYICSHCGYYLRVGAYERLAMVADEGSFEEWDKGLVSENPLDYPAYMEKLELLKEKTGLDEAVITGYCTIHEEPCVIGVMDANFLMGSMGSIVGEKITRAIEKATELRLPIILFCCSGGARMQEGIVSLMQMAKTSAALSKHSQESLPYFSILTDPTTGGVTASFAMLGDVILAEPGALIGFAGPRVIEQTIGEKLPKGFQRAEFLLEHGFIDRIVKRPKLKKTLKRLIKMHKHYDKSSEKE